MIKANKLIVRGLLAAGTDGGTFTQESWVTRTLNTVDLNGITGASVASNQITLPAGTYTIEASAPAFKVGLHRARLYNVTAAAALVEGSSEKSDASDSTTTRSVIVGAFTLSEESVLDIRHRCSVTGTDTGLGVAANMGIAEVYTMVTIEKII